MTTILRCSEYRCSNRTKNVNQYRAEGYRSEGGKPSLNNLLCNVHAGALKRSRYRDDPLPLTDKDRERLLKEQAKVDAAENEAAKQRAIEGEQRAIENHAEEWASLDLPGGHRLVRTDRDMSYSGEPTYEGKVWSGDEPQDRYDSRWFNIEPTHRHYGEAKPGARLYPYVLRVTRGANLTPNEARALAAALVEAADKAEELNSARRPE